MQGFNYLYVADPRNRAAADRYCASVLPGGRVAYATALSGQSPTWTEYYWIMDKVDTYLSTLPFSGPFPPPMPPGPPAPPTATPAPTLSARSGVPRVWIGVAANDMGLWGSTYTGGES